MRTFFASSMLIVAITFASIAMAQDDIIDTVADYDYTDAPSIGITVSLGGDVIDDPYATAPSDVGTGPTDIPDVLNPPAPEGMGGTGLSPVQQGEAIHAAREAYKATQRGDINLASWLAAISRVGQMNFEQIDAIVNEIIALQQGKTTYQGITPIKKGKVAKSGLNGYFVKPNGHGTFRITVLPDAGVSCRAMLRANPIYKFCRSYTARYPRPTGLRTIYRLTTHQSKYRVSQYHSLPIELDHSIVSE
jgi:hypothetical protein